MRRSREDTAETRRRIVEAASRLFRAKGIAQVSVADVMELLGLTVGGFYRHFDSKDALVADAIEAASLETTERHELAADASTVLDGYLSEFHRTHPDRGCPVAALCSEVGHEAKSTREAFTKALERLLATVDELTTGESRAKRERVLRTAASIVGAIALARATDDRALATELLDAVRGGLSEADLPVGSPSGPPRTRRPGPTSGRGRRSR
jgi:TetR/AcrR family transcriptional regulator, transcriptional repressor for nem operon